MSCCGRIHAEAGGVVSYIGSSRGWADGIRRFPRGGVGGFSERCDGDDAPSSEPASQPSGGVRTWRRTTSPVDMAWRMENLIWTGRRRAKGI